MITIDHEYLGCQMCSDFGWIYVIVVDAGNFGQWMRCRCSTAGKEVKS